MSFTKTYFLCPTSDFIPPPPFGPLSLGSILGSTSSPQYPLNSTTANALIPIPNSSPPIIETDWRKTVSRETGIGLGVYAQFLQQIISGLGLEVNVNCSKRTTNMFAFDTVTTYAFEPTSEYVEEAIKGPAIRAWLREPRQRFAPVAVSLFLVTGLKLVKGARIRYSMEGNLGVSVSPKGRWKRNQEEETQFDRAEEFVFAFRVKRLRFGRKVTSEEYTKGAFLAVEGKDKDENEIEPVLVDDVNGGEIRDAIRVEDAVEGDVYCVPS